MLFDDYTYLVAGDSIPELNLLPIEGGQTIRVKKGRIILLNFFIVECKHCKHMLEYLQEEIWPDFLNGGHRLLAVGRGHSPEEIHEFRDSGNYIIPFAADPDRKNFDLFAVKKVPRNYLFNPYGQLVYQTRGYDPDQLTTMKNLLFEMMEE